jgi:hypothetical protein
VKPKAKRNTNSYAKKMILASHDLFIGTLYEDKFSDPNVMMVGQIKECPRASNGKQYRLEWKDPLPPGVERLWLPKHLVGSSESKERLLKAIKADEESDQQRRKKKASKKSRPKQGLQTLWLEPHQR